MNRSVILALFGVLLLGVSCKKRVYCTNPPIYLSFTAFTDADLSQVIIKHYHTGSGFTNPVRMMVSGKNAVTTSGDTLAFNELDKTFGPDWDVEVLIPAAGKDFKLEGLSFGSDYYKEDVLSAVEDVCSNSYSYYINNQRFYVGGGQRRDRFHEDVQAVVLPK